MLMIRTVYLFLSCATLVIGHQSWTGIPGNPDVHKPANSLDHPCSRRGRQRLSDRRPGTIIQSSSSSIPSPTTQSENRYNSPSIDPPSPPPQPPQSSSPSGFRLLIPKNLDTPLDLYLESLAIKSEVIEGVQEIPSNQEGPSDYDGKQVTNDGHSGNEESDMRRAIQKIIGDLLSKSDKNLFYKMPATDQVYTLRDQEKVSKEEYSSPPIQELFSKDSNFAPAPIASMHHSVRSPRPESRPGKMFDESLIPIQYNKHENNHRVNSVGMASSSNGRTVNLDTFETLTDRGHGHNNGMAMTRKNKYGRNNNKYYYDKFKNNLGSGMESFASYVKKSLKAVKRSEEEELDDNLSYNFIPVPSTVPLMSQSMASIHRSSPSQPTQSKLKSSHHSSDHRSHRQSQNHNNQKRKKSSVRRNREHHKQELNENNNNNHKSSDSYINNNYKSLSNNQNDDEEVRIIAHLGRDKSYNNKHDQENSGDDGKIGLSTDGTISRPAGTAESIDDEEIRINKEILFPLFDTILSESESRKD